MTTMSDDPLLRNPLELWYHGPDDEITCVTCNDGPLLTAHIRLPDNLIGAWSPFHEAVVALSLASTRMRCTVFDGPLPAVIPEQTGPEPGNPRWLGINAFTEQAQAISEKALRQLLFDDAEIVAARVLAASTWAAGGHSVKPVTEHTYDADDIRAVMVRVPGIEVSRGKIKLQAAETAWNPGANYRPFIGGPDGTTVYYETSRHGITATELPGW